MVAQDFMNYLTKFNVVNHIGIDDFADRFNYIHTIVVFFLCITIVTMKQYFMDPINCYVATPFDGKGLGNYVDNYCWVEGTYSLSVREPLPDTDEDWKKIEDRRICKLRNAVKRFIINIQLRRPDLILL